MAGPTPVSALIHAATMVTAGVYVVARMHFVFEIAPVTLAAVAVRRRGHRALRRHHRHRAARPQEGARLLDDLAARLHVRRRRLVPRRHAVVELPGRHLPPGHARVLQGRPVPRRRLGHARPGRRGRHHAHGRPQEVDAADALDLPHLLLRHRRHRSVRRLLVEGRDPRRAHRRQVADLGSAVERLRALAVRRRGQRRYYINLGHWLYPIMLSPPAARPSTCSASTSSSSRASTAAAAPPVVETHGDEADDDHGARRGARPRPRRSRPRAGARVAAGDDRGAVDPRRRRGAHRPHRHPRRRLGRATISSASGSRRCCRRWRHEEQLGGFATFALIALGTSLLGIGLAWLLYGRRRPSKRVNTLRRQLPGLYRLVLQQVLHRRGLRLPRRPAGALHRRSCCGRRSTPSSSTSSSSTASASSSSGFGKLSKYLQNGDLQRYIVAVIVGGAA